MLNTCHLHDFFVQRNSINLFWIGNGYFFFCYHYLCLPSLLNYSHVSEYWADTCSDTWTWLYEAVATCKLFWCICTVNVLVPLCVFLVLDRPLQLTTAGGHHPWIWALICVLNSLVHAFQTSPKIKKVDSTINPFINNSSWSLWSFSWCL